MIKALQKAPLKFRQVNVNFHDHFGHGIKTPAIPRQRGDSAGQNTAVKTGYVSTIPSPEGDRVSNDWCTKSTQSLCWLYLTRINVNYRQ